MRQRKQSDNSKRNMKTLVNLHAKVFFLFNNEVVFPKFHMKTVKSRLYIKKKIEHLAKRSHIVLYPCDRWKQDIKMNINKCK